MAKTDATTTPASACKPKCLLRRAVWSSLIAVLVLFLGVCYLTRPAALQKRVANFLEESIGCEAQVGRCTLTWGGMLTIDGVGLFIPGEPGDAGRLFQADRVTIGLRLSQLLLGRVRASTVAVDSPTLYLTEDLDDGRFNYQKLISGPPDPDDDGGLPEVLPEVYLQNGEVRFGRVISGGYEESQTMSITGTLTSDTDRVGAYRFYLIQRDKAPGGDRGPGNRSEKGPTIHGRIDLDAPMFEVWVDRFEFQGPHRYLLTQAMRNWWDRLSPEGTLPRVVFSAALDDKNQAILTAQVSLDGIGLTLPIKNGQPLRMTGVSGEVSLAHGVVELSGITGEVEGIAFKARGLIDSFEPDAPFKVTVMTEPFDVPAEGGFWDKMPPVVSKYQQRFSPQGRYQAHVMILKPTPESGLRFLGSLDLLDTRFSYHKFPYPAKKLTGRITFDNEQLRLNDLVGITPNGGRAVVSGTVTPPGPNAKIDITIRGQDMPLDHYLTDAMKPKHRKVIDMFFDQQAYEGLEAKGILRSPGGGGAELVPAFALGGSASIVVRIQRPAGEGQKTRVTTDIDVAGLRSLFQFWHYPVFVDSGHVRISPQYVEVDGVVLRGVNGGGGMVDGWLELPGDGRLLSPSLQLQNIRLPVDDVLVASIPSPKDQWVRSLHLTGNLVGTGEIYASNDGQVAFTIDTQLIDAAAAPNDGGYTLEKIRGQVTVERTRVQFEDLTATRGEGTITINGQTDWGEHGVGVELSFLGDDLRIERGLMSLLPPGNQALPLLSELFETYRPDGTLGAVLKYHGGEQPDRFTLEVQPQTFGFNLNDQRIELTDLTGGVQITSEVATLQNIAGRFPAGTFKVDGEVTFASKPSLNLTFEVYAGRIDPTARALLPAAARSVIDGLSLQGPYQVTEASLLTQPGESDANSMIFQGKVGLKGAQANVGVPVTDLDATLDIYLVKASEDVWPHTDIRVHADQLRVADRLINRCSLQFQTGEHPWLIELNDLRGSIYEGTLVGDGELRLDDPSEFRFDLIIQEVALEPFLHPLEHDPVFTTQDATEDLPTRDMGSGLLSASLSIAAPFNAPQQRQGRGVVLVRDAKLYDRPLTLALLQAANFALPNERSFDRASAHYLIFGDTVRFDDIRFEAPAFVIAGSGTMDYPTTELKLRMVTHNPAAPDLGAVSSLVRTFKDELLGIEVTGKLAEPSARVVPLSGLFSSWSRVFGNTRAQLTDAPPAELQPR